MHTRRTSRPRKWSPLAAVAAAFMIVFAGANASQAAEPLPFTYDATGTTHVASTDSTIELGPAQLSSSVDLETGEFTGSMPLPGTTTRFELIGFLPVTADVAFEETTSTTGTLTPHPEGGGYIVDATASYHIRLSNIRIAGFPTFAGAFCRTKEPVTINLATPADERFQLFSGGHVAGEYSIGDFQHCGLNTWLINSIIPGSGNTIDVTLSNGQAG